MNAAVLLFSAGGLRLGVGIADVQRVVVEGHVAPVPFSHPALAGVMKDGDDVVPVFDLRSFVDPRTPPAAHKAGATVAILPTERGPVGLRLDTIDGTTTRSRALPDDVRARVLQALPEGARKIVTEAARIDDDEPFCFFNPEAFVGALGL